MRSSHLLVLVTLVAFVAGSLYLISSRMTRDPAASRPPAEGQSVSGSVRDSSGPLGAARVRFQGTPQSVFTDAAGRFDLTHPRSSGQRLTAWKEGFLIGGVSANDSPLDILLARLPQEDNESYMWVDPTPDATQSQNCGNCHGEI